MENHDELNKKKKTTSTSKKTTTSTTRSKRSTAVKKEVDKEINMVENNKKVNNPEVIEKVVIKKEGFNLLEVILIMFITLVFGALLGAALSVGKSDKTLLCPNEVKTEIPKELSEFISTYKDIKDNYYERLDDDKLLNAGIKGMIDFLGDKYSVYMNKDEAESFDEEVDGEYVGIGVEVTLDYYDEEDLKKFNVVIVNPLENGPGIEVGLKKGDIITKVDNKDITGMPLQEVVNLIKGKAGTTVNLSIKREEETFNVDVIRREIEVNSVKSEVIEKNDKKVGYIYIDIFAANTTNQFEKELIKLEDNGIDSLIIDVRGNSGGYLSTVTDIASMFLDKSKIIYQLDTKGIVESIYSKTAKSRRYPVAVLINSSSASASEILAGAMLESYGAQVIGVNSYGKGTVQKAYKLDSGAIVKYTVQKWLTPNGNWINEKGITPTIKVEQSEKYYETLDKEDDLQLQTAVDTLTK